MKKLLNFIVNILYIIMVICELIDFLALPVLFLIIGLICDFSWQYYLISVGGYFLLFAIIDLVVSLVFKCLDKKYSPVIVRKLERFLDRISKKNNIDN